MLECGSTPSRSGRSPTEPARNLFLDAFLVDGEPLRATAGVYRIEVLVIRSALPPFWLTEENLIPVARPVHALTRCGCGQFPSLSASLVDVIMKKRARHPIPQLAPVDEPRPPAVGVLERDRLVFPRRWRGRWFRGRNRCVDWHAAAERRGGRSVMRPTGSGVIGSGAGIGPPRMSASTSGVCLRSLIAQDPFGQGPVIVGAG